MPHRWHNGAGIGGARRPEAPMTMGETDVDSVDRNDGSTGGGKPHRRVMRAVSGRSIAWRILFSASVTVILALLLTGAYFVNEQHTTIDRSFQQQSQIQTDWIAAFAVEHLIAKDYPSLEHAIAEAGTSNDNILAIEVIHNGYPAATFKRSGAETGIEFRSGIKWRGQSETSLGEVRAVYSAELHNKLVRQAMFGALLTILAICVALFFSLRFMLRRTVLDPVATLIGRTEEEIARALPRSELPEKSAVASDEIQLLDRRFTALLEGLKWRDLARDVAEQRLIEHRDNLERTIEERTRALRLAQEEAQRHNRSKSEFLAAASHDLRQPLQAINLFHSALKATPLNEEQRRMMDYLSVSLNSLGDLLNGLLDISKLDAGRIKAIKELVAVEPLFAQIDAEFSSLAWRKGLRFKYFYPSKGLVLQTDSKLLLSMLGNLIGNAIKYTERGGVLVSVRRRGEEALIQVWDTGIGIPNEYREKIFDEYFQIGNEERDRAKGVGLGLSIVRRLSKLLGTQVRCRSLAGRGSIFEFGLPIAGEPAGSAPVKATAADSAGEFRGSHVTVIEDDKALAKAIDLACKAAGMTAVVHRSAGSALDDPRVLRADYIVSDFRLPGMNGIELLDEIHRRAGRPINAVVLTGELASAELATQNRSGYPVLFKPTEFERLLDVWRSQREAIGGAAIDVPPSGPLK